MASIDFGYRMTQCATALYSSTGYPLRVQAPRCQEKTLKTVIMIKATWFCKVISGRFWVCVFQATFWRMVACACAPPLGKLKWRSSLGDNQRSLMIDMVGVIAPALSWDVAEPSVTVEFSKAREASIQVCLFACLFVEYVYRGLASSMTLIWGVSLSWWMIRSAWVRTELSQMRHTVIMISSIADHDEKNGHHWTKHSFCVASFFGANRKET